MLKALLKKQFLELNAFYFQDKKTGKIRSKGGTAGFVLLFVFVFFSIGASVFGMAMLFADAFIPMGMDWLYFALMGLFAIMLGVFGDVFNTYASLYLAKDNELLLSMPIPPSKILFARMTGVFAMGVLYESLVFVPAMLVYWIRAQRTAAKILFPIVLWLLVGALVLILTCVLGYVIAALSTKMKNKAITTALLGFLLFGVYYVCYFKINSLLQSVVVNADKIGSAIRSYLFPFYVFGLAGAGSVKALLAVTAGVLALFALTYFVLSKTFIRIATTRSGPKKTVYKQSALKTTNVRQALLKKELKRFSNSPVYMLNCGLGLLILVALAVFAAIRAPYLQQTMNTVLAQVPGAEQLLAPLVAVAVCLIVSMNAVSAPSVSLEGKMIWILQSLPIEPKQVLQAKENLHILLNSIPALVCTLVFNFVLRTEVPAMVLSVVIVWLFVLFTADLGLVMGVKKPNLTWTNETVPVKQSMSVMVSLFGGWAVCILMAGGIYLLSRVMAVTIGMTVFAVVLVILTLLLRKWLYTKGAALFAHL
ncbi:MAG: hypothetical protein ACI4I5_05465 [Acutalibacteraceae bacterium]